MKKFLVAMVSAAMIFVACGDDSSSSGPNDELGIESSSSVEQGKSSSPVIPGNNPESSNSSAKSSSSGIQNNSSSSEKAKSSSSKDEKETKVSSNSVKSSSSSSVVNSSSSSNAKSSSSSAKSSSSFVDPISSSNLQGDKLSSSSSEKQFVSSSSFVEVPPTSSETESSSSSSEDKVNCSALLEGETGWNWNVPKECRFNPDIDYGTMTDERDGKVYRTVKIGDQVWMAENLNYADSAEIPSLKRKSWCYNGEPKNCDVAGRLYTWAAAIDSVSLADDADNPRICGYGKECDFTSTRSATFVQGVCPGGWHLPSKKEWNALFTVVGGDSTAGKLLKSQTGWYNRGNGTDAFGFSALPAGGRNGDGEGYNEGDYAYFWSSTELNSNYAYDVHLGYGGDDAGLLYNIKNNGFSVRCLKDKTPEPSAKSTSK
ncbi:fibrobacter succinogenes major paralogous domain-containing protein [Fibrobacter sp.]|uniref:fibrobacter succinogenes major paralogous domain-containing protein n=1 Tax=Fibrobacter sp. TaxID=35828 RepID=UPI0025C6E1E6|nr:fibrobacter succinogenes major paralogous domain-containing protein [Fibrobacter sp.]MBR3073307.1 fibrobacter succinogenes major paralogous domain-containing protein [Fibrobacter sp.]